nr:hypothetical protein [Vibrio vulnificus]
MAFSVCVGFGGYVIVR